MKVSPITVGQYYTNSVLDNALDKVNQAKGLFVPYAKKYGVSVNVDKADSFLSQDVFRHKSMQDLVDKSIVVTVKNNKTGKTGFSLVDATQETVIHSGEKINKTGAKVFSTKYSHEDNLIRTICRTVENLTNFVKR